MLFSSFREAYIINCGSVVNYRYLYFLSKRLTILLILIAYISAISINYRVGYVYNVFLNKNADLNDGASRNSSVTCSYVLVFLKIFFRCLSSC